MSEHLLDQTVARGHAAGDGEMCDDMSHQLEHAECAGSAAIEARELPYQPQRGGEHEQHVDHCAGTDSGDDGDARGRARDQPSRLLIERRHQCAFGEPQHVGAVDDVGSVTLHHRAGVGEMRIVVCHFKKIADDDIALRAVVRGEHGICAGVQLLDGVEPGERQRLTRDDYDEGQRTQNCERNAGEAQRLAAREQVFDQIGRTEA